MNDCISRQAVLDTIAAMLTCADDTKTIEEYHLLISESVKVLPSVTPQFYPPCKDCNKKMDEIRNAYDKLQGRPTGHWIEQEDYNGDIYYDCSECGKSFCTIEGTPIDNLYNYCPNCGARMEVKNEKE